MNGPAGERQTCAMQRAAQVVGEGGFTGIVEQIAKATAEQQSNQGQNNRGRQGSPHLFSTCPDRADQVQHGRPAGARHRIVLLPASIT
jgi:hypothetical protein